MDFFKRISKILISIILLAGFSNLNTRETIVSVRDSNDRHFSTTMDLENTTLGNLKEKTAEMFTKIYELDSKNVLTKDQIRLTRQDEETWEVEDITFNGDDTLLAYIKTIMRSEKYWTNFVNIGFELKDKKDKSFKPNHINW